MKMRDRSAPDFGLFFVVIVLVLFGLVMIYSSSGAFAYERFGKPHYLLAKQALAALIGLALLIFLMNFDYRKLFYLDDLFLASAIILTILTFVPGLAVGSQWLRLGPLNFQPTEFLKFSLILYLAAFMVRKGQEQLNSFSEGVLPPILVLGVASILAFLQSDFGMALVFSAMVLFMLFIGGVRIGHLLAIFFSSLPLLYLLIFRSSYRQARIVSFLNPFQYSDAEGYHLIQSLVALGSGGIFGRGLGASREKLFYLPSAYNDFIFSITGEELGLIGALFLISAFIILGYKGLKIALQASDRFGFLLAAGITFALGVQAGINFGVAVGVLPITGLTLPFISYGGSSLIVSLMMVGVLLNISKYKSRGEDEGLSRGRRDWGTSLSRLSHYGRVKVPHESRADRLYRY